MGDSAGLALGLTALIQKGNLDNKLAIGVTGTLESNGDVMEVGAIKGKMMISEKNHLPFIIVPKDAALVYKAFSSVKGNLHDIQLFHTDRGSEFKNILIDDVLQSFSIKRSLSMKGNPYDNAVAEATFKLFKTELINDVYFDSLEQLSIELRAM